MEGNVHEAKTHLSRLLAKVAMGEEVIIAKAGKPVAKLVPIEEGRRKFQFGAKGEFVVPDDFNDPLPRRLRISSGSESPPRHSYVSLGSNS